MFKCYFLLFTSILFLFSQNCFSLEETTAEESEVKSIAKPLSGTFDVTTNYIFQGLSNSNNAPAIQGGLNYIFAKTGIYFNVWGSNANYLDPQFHHVTVEIDTLAGIANSINDNWSYNIYFDRYNYPGAHAANYNELIVSVTYKIFTAAVYYSENVYGSHHSGSYFNGTINYEVPENIIRISGFSALASIGYSDLPKQTEINSYYDFMLGIQKKIKQFTLTLQWTDTAKCNSPPYDGYHILGTLLFDF